MPQAKKAALKKTLKFLSVCKNPQLVAQIIAKSPDSVVKAICNAALNAAQGEVELPKKTKKVLAKNRQFIHNLIKKGEPIHKKRRIICQTGGNISGTVLPPLLRSVFTSIGSGFI
jgi:hypothetical protein